MPKAQTTTPPRPFKLVLNLSVLTMDTSYLDVAEFGALMRLLMAYWRSGPPADDNRLLARVAGVTPAEWSKLRPPLEQFFRIGAGVWTCEWLDEELEAAYKAINANRERTAKATAARVARHRDVGRDEQRDEVRDVARNVVRQTLHDVVQIESKRAAVPKPRKYRDSGAACPSQGGEILAAEGALSERESKGVDHGV